MRLLNLDQLVLCELAVLAVSTNVTRDGLFL